MGSYAYWREAYELTCYFKLYSQKPQQSIRQRSPFANDKEAITTKASCECNLSTVNLAGSKLLENISDSFD